MCRTFGHCAWTIPSVILSALPVAMVVRTAPACAATSFFNSAIIAGSGKTLDQQCSKNRSSNVRSVSFKEILNNATINVSAGSMLDFTSGNSNIGSAVISSSNPSVASVVDLARVETHTQGTAIIAVDLYLSTGTGQTGSPVAHHVTIKVQ